MEATPEQIELLKKLQDVDRARVIAQEELSNLPHRPQVADGRRKAAEVRAKAASVQAMLDDVNSSLEARTEEYERLTVKQDETQRQINEQDGDYRRITQLTRDLDGVRKRREAIEFEVADLKQRQEEVLKVKSQVDDALAALALREEELVADYKQRSALLSSKVEAGLQARALLMEKLPPDVASAYCEALTRCKGVGLAALKGTTCQACRTPIDPARLIAIRDEAPISRCPSCGRLLLVAEEQ